MRSLYVRVVVASFVAVAISLGAFIFISDRVVGRVFRRVIDTTYVMELDDAAAAYARGGRDELATRLRRLDSLLGVSHYLTDAAGRDVVTGADYQGLLAAAPLNGEPVSKDGAFIIVRGSNDGRFRLIVTGVPPFTMWSLAPFYLLVLGSIALLSWWVSRSIVLPIRTVTRAADRFGSGDLSVRVPDPPRGGEIGTLGTAFNGMANRIETLLQAERRLLQDVSHELRSPLARLNFSAELARTAADRGAAVDRIQTDLDRLSAVVTELIEMTRAEGDPGARRQQPIDLMDLLDEIRTACGRDPDASGRTVAIAGRIDRPLHGDRELLRWGLENVVRNALRYSPPGTAVDVSVAEQDESAQVVVRDFGTGVPDEAVTRIFEPFYRVEEPRTPASTTGMGLGLSIARRAVLVHRGTIAAANAHPGLRVTIVLPWH